MINIGQLVKGAGPFLAFQRLYLASGGVNFDRSRAVQPKPRKPGQGFVSQDLPIAPRLVAIYVNSGFL